MFTSFYSSTELENISTLPKEDLVDFQSVNRVNLDVNFTDEINNVLKSKLSKINELNELDKELDNEISSLVKNYDFAKDPMEFKSNLTISEHPTFLEAFEEYETECEYVNYFNDVSSKFRKNGKFFSEVWNHCKLTDDAEENIRGIVIFDSSSSYVIKHPLNISSFMESYRLPPFYKRSFYNMCMGTNPNILPQNITIYTDKYIYEIDKYDENFISNDNVMMEFTYVRNYLDSSCSSGFRQHFVFYKRHIEDLTTSYSYCCD
jgi:hypothetical protein